MILNMTMYQRSPTDANVLANNFFFLMVFDYLVSGSSIAELTMLKEATRQAFA